VPSPVRCLLSIALLLAVAASIGACDVAPRQATTPAQVAPSASLADLTDKVGSIAMDECAVKPAALVFPDCPRFVTEVRNAALAAKGAAAGRPGAAVLDDTAARLEADVVTFTGAGCVAAPGQAEPSAQRCGPDLERIQNDLRALKKALATVAGPAATN
jgi:hypothetical protein